MKHLERQQKRLPEGYHVTTWVSGMGKSYMVYRFKPYKVIVQGQSTPKVAVDRALPYIAALESQQQ